MDSNPPPSPVSEPVSEPPAKAPRKAKANSQGTQRRMRNACITINNWRDSDIENIKKLNPQYAIMSVEVGASGTPHLQGYMEFVNQPSFSTVCDALQQRAHVEPRKGSVMQAINYCKKGNQSHEEWKEQGTKGPTYGEGLEIALEIGSLKKQGNRGDIEDVVDDIALGATQAEIARDHPVQYIKFAKGIDAYFNARDAPRDMYADLEVICYFGPTGTGKTFTAVTENPGAHVQSATMGQWWNGYTGQDTIIFDEFRGSDYPFKMLLKLTDRYPLKVQVKGGHREYKPTKVIFTGPVHPVMWYTSLNTDQEGAMAQLARRITKVVYVKSRDKHYDVTCDDWYMYHPEYTNPPVDSKECDAIWDKHPTLQDDPESTWMSGTVGGFKNLSGRDRGRVVPFGDAEHPYAHEIGSSAANDDIMSRLRSTGDLSVNRKAPMRKRPKPYLDDQFGADTSAAPRKERHALLGPAASLNALADKYGNDMTLAQLKERVLTEGMWGFTSFSEIAGPQFSP